MLVDELPQHQPAFLGQPEQLADHLDRQRIDELLPQIDRLPAPEALLDPVEQVPR